MIYHADVIGSMLRPEWLVEARQSHARRDARPGRVQGDRGPCGRRGAAHPGDGGGRRRHRRRDAARHLLRPVRLRDGRLQPGPGLHGAVPRVRQRRRTSRWWSRSRSRSPAAQGPLVPAARRVPRREGPHRQAPEGDDAEPDARRRLLEQRAVAGGVRRSVRALRRRGRAAAGLGRGALRGRMPLRAGRRAGVQRGLRRRTDPRGVRGARDRHRALQVRGRRAARRARERAAPRGLRLRPARLQGQRDAVVHRARRLRGHLARGLPARGRLRRVPHGVRRRAVGLVRAAAPPARRQGRRPRHGVVEVGGPRGPRRAASAGSTRRPVPSARTASAWRRSAGSPRRARPPSSG